MDIARVVQELREQLAAVDAAIAAMERLQSGKTRRGRPPGSRQIDQEHAGEPAPEPAPPRPPRGTRR